MEEALSSDFGDPDRTGGIDKGRTPGELLPFIEVLRTGDMTQIGPRILCAAAPLIYGGRSRGDKGSLLDAVLMETGKVNGHAMRHLWHFLDASGTDLPVDLNLLLAEDQGVRRYVSDWDFREDGPGILTIPQAVFDEADWWCALGEIKLDYEIDRGRRSVQLCLEKEYTWHPHEQERRSQCLHQAAQQLVDKGKAKEFWMVGQMVLPIPLG
jgi:hypothetical protein